MKIKKFKITIEVKTGLRIGGTKEGTEIGGIDQPVIRTLVKTNENEYEELPYIPGSSLKGKLRSILDLKYNHIDDKTGETKNCNANEKCKICDLFGSKEGKKSRIIIRDLYPTQDTIKKLWKKFPTVYKGAEIKPENTISRRNGKAIHPRFMERVVPGSAFEGEIILITYPGDDENLLKTLEDTLREALDDLEKNDYLGGSGTRGYGQIEKCELKEVNAK